MKVLTKSEKVFYTIRRIIMVVTINIILNLKVMKNQLKKKKKIHNFKINIILTQRFPQNPKSWTPSPSQKKILATALDGEEFKNRQHFRYINTQIYTNGTEYFIITAFAYINLRDFYTFFSFRVQWSPLSRFAPR